MSLTISFGLLGTLLIYIFTVCYLDFKKKRKAHSEPYISCIIPCYNDGDTIEQTIKSIYQTYNNQKLQVIIINDKSTDDSKQKIENLANQYDFLFIDQEHNTGKAEALNNAVHHAKHDILFFLDADTLINTKALNDILQRLEHERNVKAVSCGYKPLNKGFLPYMQRLEYNMGRITVGSYNISSTMFIRGGCLGIVKETFLKVNKFSKNAISEDMDLAMKINEHGHRVQQSFYAVESLVPDTLKSRYKQRIRWSSGSMQCMITHFKTWIKNPMFVIFSLIFTNSMTNGTLLLLKNSIAFGNFVDFCITLFHITTFTSGMNILGLVYGNNAVASTTKSLGFTLLTLPYVFPTIKTRKQTRKIFAIIPYAMIYTPAYTFAWTIGTFIGIYKWKKLKADKRGR